MTSPTPQFVYTTEIQPLIERLHQIARAHNIALAIGVSYARTENEGAPPTFSQHYIANGPTRLMDARLLAMIGLIDHSLLRRVVELANNAVEFTQRGLADGTLDPHAVPSDEVQEALRLGQVFAFISATLAASGSFSSPFAPALDTLPAPPKRRRPKRKSDPDAPLDPDSELADELRRLLGDDD